MDELPILQQGIKHRIEQTKKEIHETRGKLPEP